MLNVVGRRQHHVLASISYGFDRDDEFAGPFLDPLNPQSPYAEALLTLIALVLADARYWARLEAHYQQLERAVAMPPPSSQHRAPPPNTAPRRPRHRPRTKGKR